MKDVSLKFDYLEVDIEEGWLCIYDDENHILIDSETFKKILEAIDYTPNK